MFSCGKGLEQLELPQYCSAAFIASSREGNVLEVSLFIKRQVNVPLRMIIFIPSCKLCVK